MHYWLQFLLNEPLKFITIFLFNSCPYQILQIFVMMVYGFSFTTSIAYLEDLLYIYNIKSVWSACTRPLKSTMHILIQGLPQLNPCNAINIYLHAIPPISEG